MEIYGISDKGMKRTNNEDSFIISTRKKYAIVADGMGGHLGGEVASSICTERFSKFLDFQYSNSVDGVDLADHFISEVIKINEEIYQRSLSSSDLTGMGTTLSFLMELNGRIIYLNVGDSRIYLVRDRIITQISTDDSVVNDLFITGQITKEEQRYHPLKNVITKAIGTKSDLKVDMHYADYVKNDYFVLCSDGLSDMLEDEEILNIIMATKKPKRICEKLVQQANLYGGRDNITVIICKF